MINVGIVEDNPEDAQKLSGYLEDFFKNSDQEYSLKVFQSGLSFLDKYDPDFDIVFMDIEMPDMNGMETAAKLRETDKEVQIIFVTNMAQFAVRGYEVEALAYIVKPITMSMFSLIMDRALVRLDGEAERFVILKKDGETLRVPVSRIRYIE